MFLLLYSFFYQFTVYKVQRRFENRNFPFSERTNDTLHIMEKNYATYQYKRCNVPMRFWRQTDVARKTYWIWLLLTTFIRFQWENEPRNQGL